MSPISPPIRISPKSLLPPFPPLLPAPPPMIPNPEEDDAEDDDDDIDPCSGGGP